MRFILALLATLAALDTGAFLINIPRAVTVVEFHNRIIDHYFLTADYDEIVAIEAGSAGPGWERTGYAFMAVQPNTSVPPCVGCQPVERFYGTPGLGPNSHFYTANADEAAGLRRAGSGWTFEKTAFWTAVPGANGQCAGGVTVYRLYNGRWMFNDSNHRYVTSQAVREAMIARGWADEGARFCVDAIQEVPFKVYRVEIPLERRILPSAQCEDESLGVGSCLAVNNLPVPALRAGPYTNLQSPPFADATGLHSPEVYWPGGGYGATVDAVAQGLFVNAVSGPAGAHWVGVHIDTRGREASSLASINPLYQMRTTPGADGSDERFFPFARSDLPSETELSLQFTLNVRRIAVHDGSSHAYGHPTIEFIDVRSGEHLYFTALAYGRPTGSDYLAPDVGSGKVIVGTEFRASSRYGRSIASSAFETPPGFVGQAFGLFDFRMAREEFQRVIDSARTLNPRLSPDPADYLVDNFHFNNEVVGNAQIGAAVGNFSLQLVARR